MYVFLDTEFTNLALDAKPISVGFVAQDGARAFYAESADWRREECSEFVIESVLPLLDGPAYPIAELGLRIKAWLEDLGPGISLLSDSPDYDLAILNTVLHGCGWPGNVRRALAALPTEGTLATIFRNAFEEAMVGLRTHHALDDARGNRYAYLMTRKACPYWRPR